MMNGILRIVLMLLAAATIFAAPGNRAAANTIEDCEKIENWDAYNKCLATYGPKQGQRAAVDRSGPAETPGGGRSARRYSRGGGSGFIGRRNGRAFAVFDITPARPAQRRSR